MENNPINFYKDKTILVTGAAGTVGKEIVNELSNYQAGEIRLLDNNETELFYLMEEYKDRNYYYFLGDVRDVDKMEKHSYGADIIIHCAAFKHVILGEYNPFSIVQTNVIGVENVIKVANTCNVKHVLFTSSDKAVNPTNVMGTSKLMGEKLITSANVIKGKNNCIFCSVRFGNVVGSRGSVVPIFMNQIKSGGPVTVTNNKMTRFIMTKREAAQLVLKSSVISKGGEVFVTKMKVIRIPDLAEAMIELIAPKYGYAPSDIKIIEIGAKPGEKLYEELISYEEIPRVIELKDMFVILPAFKGIYGHIDYKYDKIIFNKINKSYLSSEEKYLTKDEVREYLIKTNLFSSVG